MEACPLSGVNSCPEHASGMPGILFANLISTLMASQCALGNPEIYPENMSNRLESNYDFIIVGSGSAGAVIANRLSEIENWKILLLEAGGDPSVTSEIPALVFSTVGSSSDWAYKAEPEENICQGMADKQCHLSGGKVLGGSSTINAMLYVRGHRRDYDNWASSGNVGWSYDDVLPYFKKSEDIQVAIKDDNASKLHGTSGLLTIERFGDIDPLKSVLIDAWQEMGYKYLENGEETVGVMKSFGTLRQGTRCSTAKAFLSPNKEKRNLHVSKFSHVTKILIDSDTKIAYGVQFKTGNNIKTVKASKEIILSAGSINSPQLLMLSGIGPREHLQEIGIEPFIKDLPVGHNLQDHFIHYGVAFSLDKSKRQPIPPQIILDATYAIFTGKKGPFSAIGVTDVLAFISTENDPDYPDIEFHHIHIPYNDSYLIPEFVKVAGFSPKTAKSYIDLGHMSDVIIVIPTLLRPKSTGTILLKSSDPFDKPRIFTHYLSDREDVEKMLKAVEYANKLAETNVMKFLKAEVEKLKYENCDSVFGSKAYWECSLRNVGSTIHHPVGTCKMGPDDDPEAVVDPELKVKGIKGLRVADASIMPTIISGNTNAAVVMIGEKVSDLLKQNWIKN
jgi:choline dehydrogenase-like flavoprotein